LGRRFNVSSEENESAWLNPPEGGGRISVEGGAGNAGEEKLTE
jgi:hypothetical protein